MNWLDITLLCLAGIGIVKGLFDGFVKQVVSLIALLLGFFFCSRVALWLQGYLLAADKADPQTVIVASYIIGFLLIVGFVISAGNLINRVINATPLGILNHLGGAFTGGIFTLFFICLVINGIDRFDTAHALIPQQIKTESFFYRPLQQISSTIFPKNLLWKEINLNKWINDSQ